MIKKMLVRGVGIRDRAEILSVSINKVIRTLVSSEYKITPKKKHYAIANKLEKRDKEC